MITGDVEWLHSKHICERGQGQVVFQCVYVRVSVYVCVRMSVCVRANWSGQTAQMLGSSKVYRDCNKNCLRINVKQNIFCIETYLHIGGGDAILSVQE